jgi:hypothetical protein
MNAIRKLFGPSKEEIWRQLSAEIGAQYVEGGLGRGDSVQAVHGDWVVTLDMHLASTGNAPLPYTRIRASFANPEKFRFIIHRRGFFSDIAKWLGMQDVEVGHPTFDRDFIIKGTEITKLQQLFANAKIRALIEAQPEIHFTVEKGGGVVGGKIRSDVDELQFVAAGLIKDVPRLKQLYELFAETLDELARIRG